MRLIDSLNSDAYQRHDLVLDDKSLATVTVRYMPAVQRWFIDVEHASITVRGINMCNHPNILRQFRNKAPFGLAVVVNDGADPLLQDDFTSGRSQLYLLNEADILYIESEVFAVQ